VRHLGDNAISIAPGTTIVHVGRGVNGGGVSDDAVSVASGTSIVVIGGDVSGDDVGEGIHLNLVGVERFLERKRWRKTHWFLYPEAHSIPCTNARLHPKIATNCLKRI
jgi:hypothetical protein